MRSVRPPSFTDLALSAEEWQRVCQAYQNGLYSEQELRAVATDVPQAAREVKRFLKLWHRLSPLAKRCLGGEDDVNDLYEGKIHEYRIVSRATESLTILKAPQGRPPAFGHAKAASVLAELWRARGQEPRPGRLYTDKRPTKGRSSSSYHPNAFVEFVAQALRALDPEIKSNDMARRVAKTAVDALHRQGSLKGSPLVTTTSTKTSAT